MDRDRAITLEVVNSDAFVARLRAGDGNAFADLLSCLVPKLCGYLSHDFQLSEQDAEDVALDAMVKVHKSVSQFNPSGGAKLSTWVFRITKNAAIDYKRCQARQAAQAEDGHQLRLRESMLGELARVVGHDLPHYFERSLSKEH